MCRDDRLIERQTKIGVWVTLWGNLLDLFLVRSGSIILTFFSGPLCLRLAIHTHLLCLHLRPKWCGRNASEALVTNAIYSRAVREAHFTRSIPCNKYQYINIITNLGRSYNGRRVRALHQIRPWTSWDNLYLSTGMVEAYVAPSVISSMYQHTRGSSRSPRHQLPLELGVILALQASSFKTWDK